MIREQDVMVDEMEFTIASRNDSVDKHVGMFFLVLGYIVLISVWRPAAAPDHMVRYGRCDPCSIHVTVHDALLYLNSKFISAHHHHGPLLTLEVNLIPDLNLLSPEHCNAMG